MKAGLFMLCLGWAAMALGAADGNWPQWRGPNRDGKSVETGLLQEWPEGGPRRLWSITGIGEGFSSPAVADGVAYISGERNERLWFTALDMATGRTRWSVELGEAFLERRGNGPRATATVDGGRLYFVGGKGGIFCLDRADGRVVWQRDMADFGGRVPTWGYSESVLLVGDLAIVTPGGNNCIVALDKATGEQKWVTRNLSDAAHYVSAIHVEHDGVEMIVQGTANRLVGLNPADGAELWRIDWPGRNTANIPNPVYSEGIVFWANGYRQGGIAVRLEVEDGEVKATQLYHTGEFVNHHGGYVVHEGHVYGNHNRGYSCLVLETGEVKWHDEGVRKGSVVFADGMLYTFAERRGRMVLVKATPEGLEQKGVFEVEGTGRNSWAHPAIANGRLLLRFGDHLHCFDVRRP